MRDGTLKGSAFDGAKGGFEVGNVTPACLKDGPRPGNAPQHSIYVPESSSYFPSVMTAGSAASTPPIQVTDTCNAFSIPMSVSSTRSTPLASGAGTPPGDVPYHSQQQVLSERFPWTKETQAATAILG